MFDPGCEAVAAEGPSETMRADPAERVASLADPPVAQTVPRAAPTGERVTVFDPTGPVQIALRQTPDGPVLTVAAAALHLHAPGTLALEGARLEVRARRSIELDSRGSLRQVARGDVVTVAAGACRVEGARVALASRGNGALTAARDAWINGRRVRLNT